MIENKSNIRNLSQVELVGYFVSIGEKKFRAKQVYEWIWKKGVTDFEKMLNISTSLRVKLSDNFYFDNIVVSEQRQSKDKTTKILFQSTDNHKFEGVLIPSIDRVTACISTQAGCALNCGFCATGKLGLLRNLSKGEIFEQVFQLNIRSKEVFGRGLSNLVVMGMGEPLLNYDNTIDAINMVISDQGLGMSPQRITLSTAGIAPKIKQLADDNIKFNLSLSLHSADGDVRSRIMPVTKKFDLDSLKEAIKYFYVKTNKRITYEYLMLKDVNDSIESAKMLTEFTKITPCKVNIIEYNPSENDVFQASTKESVQEFIRFVESKNLVVTLRKSKGQDIAAACGQLANKKQ